jgi:uncharacterized Fe-S cluster protein YjdI/CDGSH-type Zn-finger protein
VATREYEGAGITVYWDSDRCIHSERCTAGAPKVFDKSARPWVDPDGEPAEFVARVIDTCPSGALSYTRTDGGVNGRRGRARGEDPAASIAADWESGTRAGADVDAASAVVITPQLDGPLLVDGAIALTQPDGSTETVSHVTLCRCGQSNSKPRCDGSHARTGFKAPGVPPQRALSLAVDRPATTAGARGSVHPDVARLQEHLQCAIELEHATLPPYFCALYSLDPATNTEASEVLSSVFVEEMLHLTLAANVLNAIGGRPRLDIPEMLPGYPRCLPHGDPTVQMSLLPFGPAALNQFLRIERPAASDAPAQEDRYETIGQFYDAIRHGLIELSDELGEEVLFCGDPSRQINSSFSYGGSGRIIAVDGLDAALAALAEIVEQGEGASGDEVWDGDRDMFHAERDEVAHFYRIQELLAGRRYRRGDTPSTGPTGVVLALDLTPSGVRPMRPNQRIDDHPVGHPTRIAQEGFNRLYCELLDSLDRAFNGCPETLGAAVGVMYQLKDQVEALLTTSNGDGTAAGPTFEFVPTKDRS